jgi:hypothetical protein
VSSLPPGLAFYSTEAWASPWLIALAGGFMSLSSPGLDIIPRLGSLTYTTALSTCAFHPFRPIAVVCFPHRCATSISLLVHLRLQVAATGPPLTSAVPNNSPSLSIFLCFPPSSLSHSVPFAAVSPRRLPSSHASRGLSGESVAFPAFRTRLTPLSRSLSLPSVPQVLDHRLLSRSARSRLR